MFSPWLGLFGGFVGLQLLQMHDIPVDGPSFAVALFNFAAGGTILVFWIEFGLGSAPPLQLQQAYLVVISALLAWSATKTPEWTTWGLLGAVAVFRGELERGHWCAKEFAAAQLQL